MRQYVKAIINLLIALIVFLFIIFIIPKAIVYFLPFVVGWIVALIAAPLVRFFEEKVKLKRKVGSAFVIVAVIAIVVLILYFAGVWVVEQSIGLIGALPDMWNGMEQDLNGIGKTFSFYLDKLPGDIGSQLENSAGQLSSSLGELIGKIGTPTIAVAGNIAKSLPSIFIGVIMALLSAYLFVADRVQLNNWCREHVPVQLQKYYNMIRKSLSVSIGGYFKAQLKIEVWMYFLLLIGLAILHVNYFALIALIIAFMDFLPFLGTGTVLIPWAVIRLFTQDYKTAIGLLIIWGGGQLARQLIQPKIVGDSIGVPPIPTLILLFVGYKMGSVVGMIFAVPIGLLVYSMYQEGVFNTTRDSVLILLAGLNNFRRIDRADMYEVEEMMVHNAELKQEIEEQKRLETQEREASRQKRREDRKRLKKNK